MWGPSLVKPGRTEHQIISSIDILPTIAGIVGQELETNGLIDGLDQKDFILSGTPSKCDTVLYYSRRGKVQAIRKGDFKYFLSKDGNPPALYDLKEDIAESKNIAHQQPQIVNALDKKIKELDQELTENKRTAGYTDHK